MRYRVLGRTGLRVSELGFGCGAGGGLLVRGDPKTAEQVVARAIELGINYFDTARLYGDGLSEANLGAALHTLRADVLVGTKVRPVGDEVEHLPQAITAAVEDSLRRLQRDRLDLIQLHNGLASFRQTARAWLSVSDVEAVARTFETLKQQGKVRFWGLNGLGESDALLEAVATSGAYTIQTCYNLLNPSAGAPTPPGFPFQDYRQIIDHAAHAHMGVIAFRVLAGGALSGTVERAPLASATVDPIASHPDYAADVALAQRFAFVVQEGHAASLVEAAIRFVLSKPQVSTALVGLSSLEQLEQAVAYAAAGPLPAEVLQRCTAPLLQAQARSEERPPQGDVAGKP